jgi:L-lysine exporter family protein LysE/ArgO
MVTLGLTGSAFSAGMLLSLSLIMAIGPQNAHLLRMGLRGQHLWLTAFVCAVADISLILLAVFGLSMLGGLSPKLHGAMLGAGIVFLVFYGWQAMMRAVGASRSTQPTKSTQPTALESNAIKSNTIEPNSIEPISRTRAVLMALAFSWLNPHAWIDTAVLIGTASLAYQAPGNAIFGLGAVTGSVVWFVVFGGLVCWLGNRLNHARIWQWVDAMVAIMMWSIAAVLLVGLLR